MDTHSTDRTLYLLYASETGVTEDHAQELGRTLERLRFTTRVLEMDKLDIRLLPTIELAVFMTSTTGQGDMPANMQKLWKFLLRRKLPQNLLARMKFTTFGLGDSTYPKFNWAVKKLHKRLVQLGAQEVYPRGEADERHEEGIEGTLIPWITDLCRSLLEKYPLPAGIEPIPPHELLPTKYILKVKPGETPLKAADYPTNISAPRGSEGISVTLTRNERVTPKTHFQDVRHLSFGFPEDYELDHLPGDALSVLPQNTTAVVEEFLSVLNIDGVDPDQPLLVSLNPQRPSYSSHTSDTQSEFVSPLTLRTLVTHHIDVTAIPRRSFFSFISSFSSDETHVERLREFTDPKYVDELYDYTTRPRRSISEVLQEFSSVKVPLSHLLEVIPRIRPRLFSIASSRLQHPPRSRATHTAADEPDLQKLQLHDMNGKGRITGNELDLLVAIVKYRTVIKKIREGLCTRYLSSLPVGSRLSVCFSRGGLMTSARTRESHTPVVMVGPGTGVAPMRALVWERTLEKDNNDTTEMEDNGNGKPLTKGKNVLFFGCRGEQTDYFFKDEWEQLAKQQQKNKDGSSLFQIIPAFSRDQKQKVYVQNRIREHKEMVFNLLHDLKGVVYVCGSSGRMPQAVREALIEVFESEGKWDRDKAEAYFLNMEREGRYRQETW